MDFDFNTEQYLLRDSVRAFLSEQWGPRKLRAAAAKDSPELWAGLRGLGLQTLLVPEEFDGAFSAMAESRVLISSPRNSRRCRPRSR